MHTDWGHSKLKLIQIKFNQMPLFEGRGKPKYPGENLSEQRREPTNPTHTWCQVWKSDRGHIGEKGVPSPLCHHCSPNQFWKCCFLRKGDQNDHVRVLIITTVLVTPHPWFLISQRQSTTLVSFVFLSMWLFWSLLLKEYYFQS